MVGMIDMYKPTLNVGCFGKCHLRVISDMKCDAQLKQRALRGLSKGLCRALMGSWERTLEPKQTLFGHEPSRVCARLVQGLHSTRPRARPSPEKEMDGSWRGQRRMRMRREREREGGFHVLDCADVFIN